MSDIMLVDNRFKLQLLYGKLHITIVGSYIQYYINII